KALRNAGLDVTSTAKWELSRSAHPVVAPLLEYKRLARLLSANGWGWLDAWVTEGVGGRAGRFRTDYVPGGVVTGRWATSGGGAVQSPRAGGAAVVADRGWRLVVADAAQVEPRALAGMAGGGALAAAGRDGDLYAGLVSAGVVETRERAKVGMLSALYGGTAGEAGGALPRLRRAYPRATSVVHHAAEGGAGGGKGGTRPGWSCPVFAGPTPARRPWSIMRPRSARREARCAPGWGGPALHRGLPGGRSRDAPASQTHSSRTSAAPAARPGTVAGSRATSSSRARRRSGRCAGWRRSGAGCATSSQAGNGRTWSSSCTTRSSCTRPSTSRRPWSRSCATPPRAPGGSCLATSRSPSPCTSPL